MTAGDPQVPESEITKDMRAFQEGWEARGEFDRLRVTTDEQAPVTVMTCSRCFRTFGMGESTEHDCVPAPEETVETTEERPLYMTEAWYREQGLVEPEPQRLEEQAPVRCGAETSTRWPDYMTYSCMLPKGHPASHENPAGRISWTDGDCWWPDESALEPAGEADDELEDWQCRACGRADYDHPRLVSDHVFERAGEEKGAEAPQSHERRSSADTSSIARPAPSSGMPGLTEAHRRGALLLWAGYADESSNEGIVKRTYIGLLDDYKAAIAAEARAPLEEQLAAVTAERDEARANAVVQVANAASEMLREAERQRDEALAAVKRMLRAFDYWNANRGKDSGRDEEMFRAFLRTIAPLRALTPPASTAAEEETDAH